jgi:MFS family permease
MIPRHHRAGSMAASTVAVSVAVLGLSLVKGFGLAFPALLVTSLGLSLIFGLSNTIVQERAPGHLRGRVSAVMGLSFFGLMPLAGLGVTSLADAIGMRTALAASAVFYGIGSLAILAWIGQQLNEIPAAPASAEEVSPEIAAIS